MLDVGTRTSEVLDELESHLREEIEQRVRWGASEQAAFEMTIREIGEPNVLKTEFAKIQEPVSERLKRLFCVFADVPDYQLAMNMNTSNQNLKPRWVTYLKTAALIVPGIFVWAAFCTYAQPKLNEVCAASGMTVWKPITTSLMVSDFLRRNFIPFSVLIVATVVLLEWRSVRWPRYRRVVFGVVAYASNFLVLILIASLAVLAVAAGAHVLQGK